MESKKRITVNKKLISKIDSAIAERFCLTRVYEFQENEPDGILFEERPETWTKLENAINDYTVRLSQEIKEDILKILNGES